MLAQSFSLLIVAGMYAAMGSYTALSLLKLYGIARPLHVRAEVRLSCCLKVIAVRSVAACALTHGSSSSTYPSSWTVPTALIASVILFGLYTADLNKTMKYAVHVAQVIYATPVFLYVITIVTYMTTGMYRDDGG